MNSLVIQKTDSTPEISFSQKGELKIIGRSLPEDVHKFYDPLIEWVKKLEADTAKVDLKLEYLNTSSTKKLLNLLIALDENSNVNEVIVNWHYEFDDIEMEDLGGIYQEELTRIKFHFIEGVDIF
ncbi:MAG TPA: nuclear pore complex subunit [Bacteroidales bacterium]|nr:nuclear pore complex subunit [Bacteroidales bacterium]